MKNILDLASALTLVLTLILFLMATLEHGFTHDLLLEAGVFLVSMKLVLNAVKTDRQLKAQTELLEKLVSKQAP